MFEEHSDFVLIALSQQLEMLLMASNVRKVNSLFALYYADGINSSRSLLSLKVFINA